MEVSSEMKLQEENSQAVVTLNKDILYKSIYFGLFMQLAFFT